MSDHTKEPWVRGEGYSICTSEGKMIACGYGSDFDSDDAPSPETASAIADRIVADHNALAGKNPEALGWVVEAAKRFDRKQVKGPVDMAWFVGRSLEITDALTALEAKT